MRDETRRADPVVPRFPRVVDDVTVRLVAAVVLVIALLALGLQQPWLYAVLAVDFVLRAAFGPKASPVARFVTAVVRPRVPAPFQETAGPPKRFAATIGAVLTVAATVLWLAGATGAAYGIGVVMVVFPALEAIAGYCVGCKVFGLLMRAGLVPDEICAECNDLSLRQRRLAEERSVG